MSKIGNKELANELVEKHGLSKKDAEQFVSLMFDVLNDGLRQDKLVKVKGLGTFKIINMSSRRSIDVNTGNPITIESRDKLSFTPDNALRDKVNAPFAQFDTVVLNDGVDFTDIDRSFSKQSDEEPAKEETKLEDNKVPSEVENVVQPEHADVVSHADTTVTVEDAYPSESAASMPDTEDDSTDQKQSGASATYASSDEMAHFDERVHKDAQLITDKTNEERSTPDFVSAPTPDADVLASVGNEHESFPSTPEDNKQEVASLDVSSKDSGMEIETAQDNEHDATPVTDVQSSTVEHHVAQEVECDEDSLDEEATHRKRLYQWLALVASVLVFFIVGGGYYFFRQLQLRDNRISHLEAIVNSNRPVVAKHVAVKTEAPKSVGHVAEPSLADKPLKPTDNPQKDKTLSNVSSEVATKKPVQVETKKTMESDKTKAKEVPSNSDYNNDVRIRTGAYTIVGIEKTVTVKDGQTLSGISRTYLGPGMECYIEAVNSGKRSLAVGDKVNIPKLVLKKKLRK